MNSAGVEGSWVHDGSRGTDGSHVSDQPAGEEGSQPRGPSDRLGPHVRFFLSETPSVLLPMFVLACGLRVWIGTLTWVDVAVPVAIVAFNPFSEWLIHRVVQHSGPIDLLGRTVEIPQSRTHRRHHENPWVIEYILLGKRRAVEFVIVQGSIVLVASLVLFRSPVPALSAQATSIILTLWYEWSHYLMHTTYRPRSAWFRKRQQNHRRHHFRDDTRSFGINGLIADRILRTSAASAPTR